MGRPSTQFYEFALSSEGQPLETRTIAFRDDVDAFAEAARLSVRYDVELRRDSQPIAQLKQGNTYNFSW